MDLALLLGLCVLVPPFGLYALYTWARLTLVGLKLRRRAASRGFTLGWKAFVMFPTDLEDPICLEVELRRGAHAFSFNVFRSLLPAPLSRVRVEQLGLAKRVGSRFYIDLHEKVDRSYSTHLLGKKKGARVLAFDDARLDARYRLCEEVGREHPPDALEVLRTTFAREEVREALSALDANLAFDRGGLEVSRFDSEEPFEDWVDRVARLADTLEGVDQGVGPYR